MKAVRTCETSFNVNETTRRCIPEDCHLHTRCRENLKSHASREVYHKQAVIISSFLHDIRHSRCLWNGFKHEHGNQDRKVQYLVQNEPTIMANDMQNSEFHLSQQITSQCPNDTNALRLDNFTVCELLLLHRPSSLPTVLWRLQHNIEDEVKKDAVYWTCYFFAYDARGVTENTCPSGSWITGRQEITKQQNTRSAVGFKFVFYLTTLFQWLRLYGVRRRSDKWMNWKRSGRKRYCRSMSGGTEETHENPRINDLREIFQPGTYGIRSHLTTNLKCY
jgi:hypothetical protein